MAKKGDLPSAIAVQKFLGGVDYPAAKQDLVDKARKEGADKEILAILERIPDEEYQSPIAVSREVSKAS